MTPWQFRIFIDGYRNRQNIEYNIRASLMWYGATIPMMKKVPPLKSFLQQKDKVAKKGDGHIMWSFLKGYQQRRENDHSGKAER